MSGSIVCPPTNIFPLSAADLKSPHIIPVGCCTWGVLESLQPIGGGLLHVRIKGLERFVDEELLDILQPLIGQDVAVTHLKEALWAASRMPV